MTDSRIIPRALFAAPLAAALAIGACAEEPAQTDDVAEPVAEELPENPLAGDVVEGDDERQADVLLLDGETAEGAWAFNDTVAADYGPRAIYGGEATEGVFSIACDGRAGQLVLSRAGTVSPGREVAMKIVTAEETLEMTAQSSIGELPMIEARIAPGSETATTLAEFGEPFAVAVETTDPLLLSAPSDQIARTVDACRERS